MQSAALEALGTVLLTVLGGLLTYWLFSPKQVTNPAQLGREYMARALGFVVAFNVKVLLSDKWFLALVNIPTMGLVLGLGGFLIGYWVGKRRFNSPIAAAASTLITNDNMPPVEARQVEPLGFPWVGLLIGLALAGVVIALALSHSKSPTPTAEQATDTTNTIAEIPTPKARGMIVEAIQSNLPNGAGKITHLRPTYAKSCEAELAKHLSQIKQQDATMKTRGLCTNDYDDLMDAIVDKGSIDNPYVSNDQGAFVYSHGSKATLKKFCLNDADRNKGETCILPKGW